MKPTSMDRVQAWLRGELSEGDVRALQQELSRDPELSRWAADYARVFELTRDEEPLPACRVSVEDVMRDEPSRRAVPWAAVAAALALAASLALWVSSGSRSGAPALVLLQAIPERAGVASTAAIPVQLASYQPVVDGEIAWIDDELEARRLALATGRRIFVFGTYPECPIAEMVRRDCLSKEEVLAITEEYVPLAVDLTGLDRADHDAAMATGYPYMEVEEPTGDSRLVFSGSVTEGDVRDRLEEGLADPDGPQLPWAEANALTQLHESARNAEDERRWLTARDVYRKMSMMREHEAFANAGLQGLARIAAAARAQLLRAESAETDDALRLLERAVREFAGTKYEADFRRVLQSLQERGVFPSLAWGGKTT